MGNPVLSIVIPCYNEEKVLPVTSGMFLAKIRSLITLAIRLAGFTKGSGITTCRIRLLSIF